MYVLVSSPVDSHRLKRWHECQEPGFDGVEVLFRLNKSCTGANSASDPLVFRACDRYKISIRKKILEIRGASCHQTVADFRLFDIQHTVEGLQVSREPNTRPAIFYSVQRERRKKKKKLIISLLLTAFLVFVLWYL